MLQTIASTDSGSDHRPDHITPDQERPDKIGHMCVHGHVAVQPGVAQSVGLLHVTRWREASCPAKASLVKTIHAGCLSVIHTGQHSTASDAAPRGQRGQHCTEIVQHYRQKKSCQCQPVQMPEPGQNSHVQLACTHFQQVENWSLYHTKPCTHAPPSQWAWTQAIKCTLNVDYDVGISVGRLPRGKWC